MQQSVSNLHKIFIPFFRYFFKHETIVMNTELVAQNDLLEHIRLGCTNAYNNISQGFNLNCLIVSYSYLKLSMS